MQEFSKRVSKKLSKLSDAQIQTLIGELTAENAGYEAIIESLATGLIIVDRDWHVLKSNKAAQRYVPMVAGVEESRTKPLWEIIADEDIAEFLQHCYESDRSNCSEEYTLSTSGGAVRFVDISVLPLVQHKELVGSIITIDDVTEKRNQEILLHRMEALAGLTSIAASVAHEIKNPLGAISIHIQLMQKAIKKKRAGDGKLPEPKFAENYLDIVNQEIDRLNKIVVNFLMAVRPISATLELVDPNKLLEQFVAFFQPEFAVKHIAIKTNFCKDCPRLLIDQKLFREVIVNLAQNALAAILEQFPSCADDTAAADGSKELPFSTCRGQLSITTQIKDDTFFLHFADNGSGMSEETASHIFEPYFTTKANGTGLGLAMVYKIIKEFSGDITVRSVEGEGTEFVIALPIPQKDKRLLTYSGYTGATTQMEVKA